VVRRCQLRGSPRAIATGTAGGRFLTSGTFTNHYSYVYAGRIRFEDNVFLNAGSGFNTDTGSISQLAYENNAFLDIVSLGNMGAPTYTNSPHNGYTFKDNLIRLIGRDFYKNYRDMCIGDPSTAESDPTLALGRMDTNISNGLVIAGGGGNLTLSGNDFTT